MAQVVLAGTVLSFIPALYRLKEIADALRTCTQYDQDPRVNAIHALFVAQQVRAVDWANQNGVSSFADVESLAEKLPRHWQETLIANWKGLMQWNEHSIAQFASYGIDLEERQTEGDNPRIANTITLKKLKWTIDGFERLSEHVNTLKAFNDVLWECTHPLQRQHRLIDSGHSVAALSIPADPVSIAGTTPSIPFDNTTSLVNSQEC